VVDRDEKALATLHAEYREAREVAEVLVFMLTRPRGTTIRDVVVMPSHFDL